MSSRPLLVINGYDFGAGRYYGINRNAMEVTMAVDRIAGRGVCAFDVEVAVPSVTEHTPAYENVTVKALGRGFGSFRDKVTWRQVWLPRFVAREGGLGLDMTLALPHRGRYCVFDYDTIPEDWPTQCFSSHSELKHWYYSDRVRKSLSSAEVVFTDSEYAKKRILYHYKISPEKIVVVPCAWQHMLRVEEDDSVLPRLCLEPGQYFFSLGSRYPYKNFRWVEAAARQNPQYRFVVTGEDVHVHVPGTGEEDVPANVTFTGYLSDGEVKALETHCRAFLHPSLEEGFGIPPMEAMSAGARCIVSSAASLPEVYGDSVWYIDPTDYDHIDLDAITARPLKGTAEDVLSRYSWEESARIILDTIEERCL